MRKVHTKIVQGAHPETDVHKQTVGYQLTTESETGLYLVTVASRGFVYCDLAFERTLELKQDNCPVWGLEVTVWAAGYFAIEEMVLGKVE